MYSYTDVHCIIEQLYKYKIENFAHIGIIIHIQLKFPLQTWQKCAFYTFTSAEDMYAEIALAAFSLMVNCGFDRSVNTTSCIWLDIYTGAAGF